jgi:hypothetical protein
MHDFQLNSTGKNTRIKFETLFMELLIKIKYFRIKKKKKTSNNISSDEERVSLKLERSPFSGF